MFRSRRAGFEGLTKMSLTGFNCEAWCLGVSRMVDVGYRDARGV